MAVPAKSKFQEFQVMLTDDQRVVSNIKSVLPANMSYETLRRMAFVAAVKNPAIVDCTQASLMLALMEAGRLGLYPDGRMAAIVPYKQVATLLPMYQGLAELAYGTGKVKSIRCQEVYSKDKFALRMGHPSEPISHEPFLGPAAERGDVLGAYALIELTTGGLIPEWMALDEIEGIRNRSVAYQRGGGPWFTDVAAMRRKTVLRRAIKYAPKSAELQRALSLEDDAESGVYQKAVQLGAMEMPEAKPPADGVKAKPEPPKTAPPTPTLAERAAKLYAEYCAICREKGGSPLSYAQLMDIAGGKADIEWAEQQKNVLVIAIETLEKKWIPTAKGE